jgi:hypothetical protein
MSEFGSLDLEAMAGEDARLNTQGGGQNNFLDQFVPMPQVKPGQTGTVAIRILPPVKGAKLFQYNRVHSINGRKVHCPRPLVNQSWDRNVPCPICDYYSSLWKQADKLEKQGNVAEAEALKDEARDIKPVERYYYNAIVRNLTVDGETKQNVGPRILSVGKILHKQIIRAIVGEEGDPDSKLGNITDLKNGYDFIIRKEVTSGEGFPKYERSSFARSPSPAGTPEEVKTWAESLHDLTKLRNPKEVDYIEKELAIHRGLIQDDTESFNTEQFDAKWGGQAEEQVASAAAETTTTVDDTPAPETTPTATETATPAPADDAPIEDEDFLKELEDMGG